MSAETDALDGIIARCWTGWYASVKDLAEAASHLPGAADMGGATAFSVKHSPPFAIGLLVCFFPPSPPNIYGLGARGLRCLWPIPALLIGPLAPNCSFVLTPEPRGKNAVWCKAT